MLIVLPPTVFFLIFLYRMGFLDHAEMEYRPGRVEVDLYQHARIDDEIHCFPIGETRSIATELGQA